MLRSWTLVETAPRKRTFFTDTRTHKTIDNNFQRKRFQTEVETPASPIYRFILGIQPVN